MRTICTSGERVSSRWAFVRKEAVELLNGVLMEGIY